MKNLLLLVLAVSLLFAAMLSGCATMKTTTIDSNGNPVVVEQPGSMFGPSSYDIGYQGMYVAHEQGKAVRADKIQAAPCPTDPVAAAYCGGMKVMGIAMLSTEKFDVKAPVTGFDVLYKGVDSIVPVTGFVSLYKLGAAGITNAGSKFGDNAQVSDSMNHVAPTTTNVGYGSSSSTASGTQPAQAPVIVEPSYPPADVPLVTP